MATQAQAVQIVLTEHTIMEVAAQIVLTGRPTMEVVVQIVLTEHPTMEEAAQVALTEHPIMAVVVQVALIVVLLAVRNRVYPIVVEAALKAVTRVVPMTVGLGVKMPVMVVLRIVFA